jgi:methylmalonyl-CoA epimerase
MIRDIDHIGIAVQSIAEARRLYEALGMQVEAVEEVAAEGVRVAMIPCGHSRIELLEATTPDSPIARFLKRRGGGVHHVCLSTSRVVAEQERLEAAGYRILRPRPTRGAGGCWVQFVDPKSTGGVLLELAEPAILE